MKHFITDALCLIHGLDVDLWINLAYSKAVDVEGLDDDLFDKEIAKKGGDLGFVIEDALPAEVMKQVKTMIKGEIAKPIQISNSNWVIIKFEDERPAEILPFEKVKESFAQNLAQKAIEDFISQSFEKAKISILIK